MNEEPSKNVLKKTLFIMVHMFKMFHTFKQSKCYMNIIGYIYIYTCTHEQASGGVPTRAHARVCVCVCERVRARTYLYAQLCFASRINGIHNIQQEDIYLILSLLRVNSKEDACC